MKILPNKKIEAVLKIGIMSFDKNSSDRLCCLQYYDSKGKWITSSPPFYMSQSKMIMQDFLKTGKMFEYLEGPKPVRPYNKLIL